MIAAIELLSLLMASGCNLSLAVKRLHSIRLKKELPMTKGLPT